MTVSATYAIDEMSRHRTITDSYEYDAFGNKVNSTGTTPNNYLYRGEQLDPDLGMYYLRARYYNPLTGRFLSVDSQAGQGQRRYEYANADPIDGMDPSGNEAIIEWALLQFYPKRLPIFFPGFPSWCGFEMGAYLRTQSNIALLHHTNSTLPEPMVSTPSLV